MQDKSSQTKRPQKRRRKPREKPKKGEKLPSPHPGIVQKLVDRILEGHTFEKRSESLLQAIFADVAVKPSAEMGLLGDLNNMTIAGDGTCIETGNSPYGKATCDCREQGIYNCDCKRIYSDPDARWGWDSYNERYYYGYSLYAFTAVGSPYDLPIYLRPGQAPRHDNVLSVVALPELLQLYPDWTISRALYDAAHDAYPIYQLHLQWGIEPFIDLNERRKGKRLVPWTNQLR